MSPKPQADLCGLIVAGRAVGGGGIGTRYIAQAGFQRFHLKPYRAIARQSEQASACSIRRRGECDAEQA